MNFPAFNFPSSAKTFGAFKVPSPKKRNDGNINQKMNNQPQVSMPASILYLNYFNQILMQQSIQTTQLTTFLQDENSTCSSLSSSTSRCSLDISSLNKKQAKSKDSFDDDNSENCKTMSMGKRKRKSERDLSVLRDELKKELMWSREKITLLSDRLGMNETQIYKWWWDQTRKRAKRLQKQSDKKTGRAQINLEQLADNDLLFPSTDEFGGYSSRLRITDNGTPVVIQNEVKEDDSCFEKSLCELLGIDIEAKALEIVNADKKFRDLSQLQVKSSQ